MQSFAGCISCDECHNAALALYDADNAGFLAIASRRTPANTLALAAHVSFVHLHRLSLQLHVSFGQQRANLAKHPPSGFVGYSGFALNLLCRDAATSGSHQVHSVIPQPQRSAAVLKDRPGHRGNLIQADIAGIDRAALDAMVLLLLPTLSAVRNPAGETLLFEVFDASVIVWKLAVEIVDRVS